MTGDLAVIVTVGFVWVMLIIAVATWTTISYLEKLSCDLRELTKAVKESKTTGVKEE